MRRDDTHKGGAVIPALMVLMVALFMTLRSCAWEAGFAAGLDCGRAVERGNLCEGGRTPP